MGEVVQIHLGNCGNQIGSSFYEYLCDEHGLDAQGNYVGESALQKEKINMFFQPEISGSKYSARALLVDLDCSNLNSIRSSSQGKLFRAENIVNSKNGANNIWAKGLVDSDGLMPKVMEQLRREVELCDSLRSLQVISSISGGTGGGMCSNLLETIRDEYKTLVSTVSVMASQQNSENTLAAYNNVLTINSLREFCDQCIMVDNDALYSMCENVLFLENASFLDLNHLVAGSFGLLTGPMRFPSPLCTDFQSLVMNMNPFDKLHFLSLSLAPLAAKLTPQFKTLSAFEVFQQMNQPQNFLMNLDLKADQTLAAGAFFRGHMGDREVETLTSKFSEKNALNFSKSISKTYYVGHSSVPPKGMKLAGSSIINSTNFQTNLETMKKKFSALFQRKVFLHWYKNEGVDEEEFTKKLEDVNSLIAEYDAKKKV